MSNAAQGPSRTITAGLVAAHVIVTPAITWLATVYSTRGAPWRAEYALWEAEFVLLGVWCGMSAAPIPHRLRISLAGLLGLFAMHEARQLYFHGVPPRGLPWSTYAAVFGHFPLYFGMHFAAAVSAVVLARTVWPRWRLVAVGADSERTAARQYSIRQLMFAVTACTPVLLAARLTHDYVNLETSTRSAWLMGTLVQSSLSATIAVLSVWAALGRTHVIVRLAVALFTLPIAVLLMCYAIKYPSSEIIGRIGFEEMKMVIALVTLLICRWNGYRIGTIPAGCPKA